MKSKLNFTAWFAIIVIAILCPLKVAAAGATSQEINEAIVLEGSIPLTWENDATYPWILSDGILKSGNIGKSNSESIIKFKFNSEHVTTISFNYQNNDYNSGLHWVEIYVDNILTYNSNSSRSVKNMSFRLPKGSHTIAIRDALGNTTDSRYFAKLWDVKVINSVGATDVNLASTIVLPESIALSWENDSQYPWIIENGKAKSNNYGRPNSSSKLSFTYHSDNVTDISFKYQNNDYNSSVQLVEVYVDGNLTYNSNSSQSVKDVSLRLPKGNHTISIRDSIGNTSDYRYFATLWDVKVTNAIGASNEELNNTILKNGSFPLNWHNDDVYPWIINDGYAKSNNYGRSYTSSRFGFDYDCDNTSLVSFKYQNNDYNSTVHFVEVFVDGERRYESNNSQSVKDISFFMQHGHHEVVFRDSIGNSVDYRYFMKVWDVCLTKYPKLEEVVVAPNSLPIVLRDEGSQPWYIEDGAAKSANYRFSNSNSIIRSTIKLDKRTKLSFNTKQGYNYTDECQMIFSINGKPYYRSNNSNWHYVSVVLQPGEYELEWKAFNKYSGNDYYALVKDISISDNWVEVNITPGMLGVETLYKVNVLTDVEMLKISGTMNDSDWATIKLMKNLHALDISETSVTSLADNIFNGLPSLNTVALPNSLETIGKESFTGTDIYYITIPNSVKRIGQAAFKNTRLQYITFEDNSCLTSIGYEAFRGCSWLEEFLMPNTVSTLERYSNYDESYTFYECTSMKKIVFSDALTYLPGCTCYANRALEEVHFPTNLVTIGNCCFYESWNLKSCDLPASVRSIGEYAFNGMGKIETLVLPEKLNSIGRGAFEWMGGLKQVELPSGISSYDRTFDNCSAIQKIVCRAATPPSIVNDAFRSVTKANVTLEVPSFAVATYKLDPYWYQFGNIIEGSPVDYWRIMGDLKLLNNRRMEGKPDIDLYYGGKLTVGGDAPMEVGKFDIYTSEANPSSLVSDCNAFTADEINTIFRVDANKWYYITPMVDIDLPQVNVSGTPNYVFRYYDGAARADIGAGTSWKNVSDMKLKAGCGYIFQCNASSDVIFPVADNLRSKLLSTEAIVLPLTAHPSDNAANKGWNYLGNPYPSYYDIHYMDFTAPITVWTGSTYRAYSIADDDYVLRPMQGFFVQKPDAIDVITLQTAGRQISSTVNRPRNIKSYTTSENNRFIFDIEIRSDAFADLTRVVLNENASEDYELERDASKFMSSDENVAQIYTIDSNENHLAINERPTNDGIIKLGLYLPNACQDYTISSSRLGGQACLIDEECGIIHDLTKGDYTFSVAQSGTCEGRFSLKLQSDEPSGIDNLTQLTNVSVTTLEDGIRVNGANIISVYSIDGRILGSYKTDREEMYISLISGIYIISADAQTFKVVVK